MAAQETSNRTNAAACAGEVNAKVTETDSLSMRGDLKNDRDGSNAAGTDHSIQNLAFYALAYPGPHPHGDE